MKKTLFFIALVLTLEASAIWAGELQSVIELTVRERDGVSRIQDPVTYGIPFSEAENLTDISTMGIFDDKGVEIPSQFRILSRYGGTVASANPIRMVLVDFQTDITASTEKLFHLKKGGSYTGTGNIASEDTNYIYISTGALDISIKKTAAFNLFDNVKIAKDVDKIVNDTIISAANSTADGLIVHYKGTDYTTIGNGVANAPTEALIEENGPLRTVIKIKGYLRDSANNLLKPPSGDQGMTYTFRIKAFKNKAYVKVDVRLESENFGWTYSSSFPAHNIDLDYAFLKTTLDLGANKKVTFDGYTNSYTGANFLFLQDHLENGQNEFNNFVYTVKKDGIDQKVLGKRSEGLANVKDANMGLMIATRWFWQNWPKSIEVSNNVLNAYLWPDMAYDHKFLGGIYKTHEMIYYFHGGSSGDFSAEMATLKKRLIARAPDTYYASTQFLGFMPGAVIDTPYTFPKGESLKIPIEKYNNSVKAKFTPNTTNPDSLANQTFNSLRESRPFKWQSGPLLGKYINWYGWLDFGDMVRGGTYGFPGLHYAWGYVSLMHSLRLDDDDMFDLGEELVSHKADIDIIHDPTGIDDAGPWDEDYFRGGHRYEADAHYQIGGTYAAAGAGNSPRGASHTWIKSLILQYLLTGDERFHDAVMEVAGHLSYAFSTSKTSCDGPTECWGVETRHQSRAINMLVDIWKLTGDSTYLTIANNIFVYGLLTKEGSKAGGGYYDFYGAAPNREWCGPGLAGGICDSHNYYETITIEPLINLYYGLKDTGQTSKRDAVLSYLLKHANWQKSLYANYEEANGGTYNTSGQYFPYCNKIDWAAGYKWPKGEGGNDAAYSYPYADLFAFFYLEDQPNKVEWLNLARAVFKDYMMYSCGTYLPINMDSNPKIKGFISNPSNAWLKEGKLYTKPLIYLYTEWDLSLDKTSPSKPLNLKAK